MMESLGGTRLLATGSYVNRSTYIWADCPLTSISVMTNKEHRELREEQIHSLKWAIDELEKEKEAIATRLDKSRQAGELETTLDDALSEQETLTDRIADLQDNLHEIKGEDKEVPDGENLGVQQSSLEERILIASERLAALEQDRDLEHIALRFKGEETENESAGLDPFSINQQTTERSMEEATRDNRLKNPDPLRDPEPESASQLGKVEPGPYVGSGTLTCRESTSDSLREAAAALDLDPEYLLDKSV